MYLYMFLWIVVCFFQHLQVKKDKDGKILSSYKRWKSPDGEVYRTLKGAKGHEPIGFNAL